MNPLAAPTDRWEVLSASRILTNSIYLVVLPPSQTAVKVTISDSNQRTYVWGNVLKRKREQVPEEIRREIDLALVRYFSGLFPRNV